MTRQRIRAALHFGRLALALAILAGPQQASAQSDQWDALFDRIIRLEHEVKEMRAGGGAIPLNPGVAGGGPQARGRRPAASQRCLCGGGALVR